MKKAGLIGNYLIEQLVQHGVKHVFGIPGDYVLGFYDLLSRNDKLKLVNTCDEQGAGFAADAYARINGLGAVCITYGVGGLKVANTTAQAYAEKSPVLVISGSPGIAERQKDPLLHHKIRDFATQKNVFAEFTVASTILDNPDMACREIGRIIHQVLKYKRPGYIELPRDLVFAHGRNENCLAMTEDVSNAAALQEALDEAVCLINRAKKPVILAGVEIHRFGLQAELVELAQKSGIPVAATILAKSVIADNMPFYLGIYEGATGIDSVRKYVESSDCLLLLGAFMTDVNLGIFTAAIDPTEAIYATSEKLTIKHHNYENILFRDFINGLIEAPLKKHRFIDIPHPSEPPPFRAGNANNEITVARLFQLLDSFLEENTIVVADVGDALFGANDLYIRKSTKFLSPAYYASLGFAVPGALGAQLADPSSRPLVLVGDGAFQMTGMELSTIARYGLNPIIVVLNNQGYSTERPMLDGPFNDVYPWNFSRVPEVLGAGKGFYVETEQDLERALRAAQKFTQGYSIIDVRIGRDDRSPALNRLTRRLAKEVK